MQLTGRKVHLAEVQYLANVPGVQQTFGYAWLVFNHAGAVPLFDRFFRGSTIVKNLLPAASRTPLHVIHQALNTDVKYFLTENRNRFKDRFISALNENFDTYAETREDLAKEELSLDSETGIGISYLALGNILNSALRGDSTSTSGDVITQEGVIGMKRDYPLDTNDGRIAHPLVLIELRHFVPDSHDFVEHGGFSSPHEVSLSFERTADVARAGFRHTQSLQEQLSSSTSPVHQARRTLEALSTWTLLSDAAQQISVKQGSDDVRQLLTAEEAERMGGWVDSFAANGTVESTLSSRLQALLETTKDLKLPPGRSNTADPLAEVTSSARALLALLARHESEEAARLTSVPTQATGYVERIVSGDGTGREGQNPETSRPRDPGNSRDADLLEPEDFRRHTTDPSPLHGRGMSRVRRIDDNLENLQGIPVENHRARRAALDDFLEQVRQYRDSTQNANRYQGVASLHSQVEQEMRIHDSLIRAEDAADQAERHQHLINALGHLSQLQDAHPTASRKFQKFDISGRIQKIASSIDRRNATSNLAHLRNPTVHQVQTGDLRQRLDMLLGEALEKNDPDIREIAALAKARELARNHDGAASESDPFDESLFNRDPDVYRVLTPDVGEQLVRALARARA
ncbi:hypothetical protein AB0F07_40895, partial [Streptomyces fructofermentans]|uniref:hypothetical protein n=1 Tax=Streptomyces fructofermentans TaxID=152141 RepID=UPI0033F310F2